MKRRHVIPLLRTALLAGLVAAAAGCAAPDRAAMQDGVYDPNEAENRKIHAFNKDLDRVIVRPAARGYAAAMPDDIEFVIGNFADNLSLPQSIVNSALQGNGRAASQDFYRFLVNTTIGLGGLFDTASELNMPAPADADFGQTLHVWGVGEGAYRELPVVGPSTSRDAAGRLVDLLTDPLDYVIDTPERYVGTAARVSKGLSARTRYTETIDSVLYDSADSYAAARSIYLQNRRYKLGGGGSETLADPYDTGATSQSYGDPYDE